MRPRTLIPVVAGLAVAVSAAASGSLSSQAAPLRQGATCSWVALSRGEDRSQQVLVDLPGIGVLEYGGAVRSSRETDVKDDVHVLDQRTDASGTWVEIQPQGAGPGNRIEHAAAMRTQGGASQLITYGGIDQVDSGGGGTFTWRSPLLGGGRVEPSLLGNFRPSEVQRGGHRLTVASTTAGTWANLGITADPLAESAAVYWPEGDSVVLFGGHTDEEANSAVNKLYRIELGVEPVAATSTTRPGSPTSRFGHTAVYDSANQRMIVFGGSRNWTAGLNDTWALDLSQGWDAANWSEVATQGTAPTRRFDHAAAYIPTLRWMVVFGGTRNATAVQSDLFALDLSQDPAVWTELEPAGASPPGLQDMAASWSGQAGLVVIHGGEVNSGSRRDAYGLRCVGAEPPTPTDAPTDMPTDEPTATQTPVDPTATATGEATDPATATATATATDDPPDETATPTATDEAPPTEATPDPGEPVGRIWLPRVLYRE